jgi:hypothetical protein
MSGLTHIEMTFLQIQDILQSHVDEEGLLDQISFTEIVLDSLNPSLFHKLEFIREIMMLSFSFSFSVPLFIHYKNSSLSLSRPFSSDSFSNRKKLFISP